MARGYCLKGAHCWFLRVKGYPLALCFACDLAVEDVTAQINHDPELLSPRKFAEQETLCASRSKNE